MIMIGTDKPKFPVLKMYMKTTPLHLSIEYIEKKTLGYTQNFSRGGN